MTAPPRRPATRTALLTLYAHPFELAVLIILGVSALTNGLNPAPLAAVLTGTLVGLWVAGNTLGIGLTSLGLFRSADVTGLNPRKVSRGRGMEKAGLYLIAATEAAYAVIIVSALGVARGWEAGVQLAAIAAAALLRAGAIRKAEKIELEQLERLNSRDYLRRLLGDDEEEAGDE